jgi:hypothetical protein
MGKASRTKQDGSRREKIAAARAAERAAERRTRLLIAAGALVAIIAVVVVIVVVNLNKSPASSTSASGVNHGAPTGSALTSVLSQVTSVPTSATDAAGSGGGAVTPPTSISGTPLTANGHPEMLYVGAEYCPYCAAERWSMMVALSRFGTFSGVTAIRSGSADVYPGTATWSFHGSSFTSQYLTFTPVETQTNIVAPGGQGYTTLQQPTSDQQAVFQKYSNQQAFPFVDFGNKYAITQSSYSPQILAGLTWSQIASDLQNPSSPVAQAINGTANYMTAAICKMTNNQPASACTSTVQGLQSKI